MLRSCFKECFLLADIKHRSASLDPGANSRRRRSISRKTALLNRAPYVLLFSYNSFKRLPFIPLDLMMKRIM